MIGSSHIAGSAYQKRPPEDIHLQNTTTKIVYNID